MPNTKNAVKVTQDDFKVDKSIIRHLIFSQAGTLSKALLELIMNSLDAHCESISVDFSDDMRRVVVKDNGTGFESVESIQNLFGVFGFDHTTQAEIARGRSYGRFGLGRAQCLAFGSTVWTTNQFTMEVDLKGNKTNDLPYIIKEHGKSLHKGCMIEINLYDHMSIHDKRSLGSELKRMAKYVKEDLRIDGTRVNESIDEVKWSATNDDFLFLKAQSERGLAIYNKGVLVCTYGHSKFGVSGDLVSRDKNFAVNMARNDVLVAECELWKSIPAFLKPFSEKKERKTLTNQDRIYLISQVMQGDLSYEAIKTKRIFQNADGKYFTLKQVFNHANGNITIAPDRMVQYKGMGLHRRKIAFCFSYDFADSHGFKNIEEMFDELKKVISITDYSFDFARFKAIDFEEASKMVVDTHDIIPDSELGALDKTRLKATKSMYELLKKNFISVECNAGRFDMSAFKGYMERESALNDKYHRNICLGRSEVAKAWTDGSRYIAIDIDVVRKSFESGLNGLLNLVSILVHEMCHDSPTTGSHDHDADFYERYHDVMIDGDLNVFSVATRGLESYMVENKKNNRPLSSREVRNFFPVFEKMIKQAV
jgi:hypothetical protein